MNIRLRGGYYGQPLWHSLYSHECRVVNCTYVCKIVTDGIGFHPDRIYFLCWIVDWTFNYVAPRSTYSVFAELSMSHSILSNPSNGSHGPALAIKSIDGCIRYPNLEVSI